MKESDKELLELAAKAAGFAECDWLGGDDWLNVYDSQGRQSVWNPLTDGGCALWLAAELRLQINPGKHKGDGCTVESHRPGIAGCTAFRDDPFEQMRYAIVVVAAEIGKAMP